MSQPPLGITARAIVKRVLDGDTLDVELVLPCRVRLLNCWAPELHTEEGKKSKDALCTLSPEGSRVVLQIPTTDAQNVKDVFTFGRVLGNIWREGDEDSISHLMVINGHAKPSK